MNDRDKEAVRTAKTSGTKTKTKSQQSAEKGGEYIQQNLQQQADKAGLAMADAFQAQALVSMVKALESGQYGPKTAAVLESFTGGFNDPLERWNQELLSWQEPIALLGAASDPNG